MYVIHKSSRAPARISYDGPTWDRAGIRDQRKDVYEDRTEALRHAALLTEHNGVGFEVSPLDQGDDDFETLINELMNEPEPELPEDLKGPIVIEYVDGSKDIIPPSEYRVIKKKD